MGTIITLEVGGLELDWSKNSRGLDHGILFQVSNRKRMRSDQIDYDYFAEHGEDPGSMEMAFVRTLRQVVPRIELLGFTLAQVEAEYARSVGAWREECRATTDEEDELEPEVMGFAEFRAFVTAHPIRSLDATFIAGRHRGSEDRIRGRFADKTLVRRLPHFSAHDSHAYSERGYFAGLIGVLHPYSVLRLLAENTANLDENVVWQYGPLVDAGWATASEFTPDARRTERFLIATEGSSDAHVLRHAFSLLRPEIVDFFHFIDVSERHPFPGTGNLLKFAEGLAKIDIHNQVVFVFDNDAEGFDAHQRLLQLSLPANMRAMLLPELPEFRAFPARGPNGVTRVDINRRAAAIECYLDLKLAGYPPAQVIWTNYKKELDIYHGALEHKEAYAKAFLSQSSETISNGSYDVQGIRAVLDALVSECSSVAATIRSGMDLPAVAGRDR